MRSVKRIKVLENIPVLLRTSLNVPTDKGVVTDAFRLKSAVPTISYLQKRHARVILISHISGKGTESLRPMYKALKELVPRLSFCETSIGPVARETIRRMVPGDVVMLENLRRHKGEEANDENFARELASLADVFVQDSFDVCHRKHASVVGVPQFLPSYAGLTVEKEVQELKKALKPKKPALAVVGGAKFSTKEPFLKQLLKTYTHVFVGGALANDFIRAKGYRVGTSLVSLEGQDQMRTLMKNKKLIVPVDVLVAPLEGMREDAHAVSIQEIGEDVAVLDMGPHTTSALSELAKKSKTILWSGPLGRFEHGFHDGNRALSRAIPAKAQSIIGGGDTIAALDAVGGTHKFSFVSTGGGAMLDFLADGSLPGLEALS